MFQLYPMLSRANAELGNIGEAHQADAEFHIALGEYEQASASLRQAARNAGSDGYLKQSVDSRLQEVQEILSRRKDA